MQKIGSEIASSLGFTFDKSQGEKITQFLHRINSLPDNAKALIKNCVILSKQIQLTTEKITIIIRKDKSTSSIIRSLRDSSLTTYKVILPSFYMNFLILFCQYLLFLKESNKSVSTFHYIKIKKNIRI